MKISKATIKKIIKEEIIRELQKEQQKQKRLDEALTKQDYAEIKSIIRAEVAAIMFDLFKKKNIWI